MSSENLLEGQGSARVYNGIHLRKDVLLRPIVETDDPAMCRWMCDPIIARDLGLTPPPDLGYVLRWVQRQRRIESAEAFAILAGDRVVGNVVLDQIEHDSFTARLSIYIGGYQEQLVETGMTAGCRGLEAGFERLALEKIWLTVNARNHKAIESYARLGFVREEVLGDGYHLDGGQAPLIYMGLFRDEFLTLTGRDVPFGPLPIDARARWFS